jgi:hypothetical protein
MVLGGCDLFGEDLKDEYLGRFLVSDQVSYQPWVWGSQGNEIFYVTDSFPQQHIEAINVRTGATRRLATLPEGEEIGTFPAPLQHTPGGSTLWYVTYHQEQTTSIYRLYRLNPESDGSPELIDEAFPSDRFAVSPDGREIAYRGYDVDQVLRVKDVETGAIRSRDYGTYITGNLWWAPDGTQLLMDNSPFWSIDANDLTATAGTSGSFFHQDNHDPLQTLRWRDGHPWIVASRGTTISAYDLISGTSQVLAQPDEVGARIEPDWSAEEDRVTFWRRACEKTSKATTLGGDRVTTCERASNRLVLLDLGTDEETTLGLIYSSDYPEDGWVTLRASFDPTGRFVAYRYFGSRHEPGLYVIDLP